MKDRIDILITDSIFYSTDEYVSTFIGRPTCKISHISNPNRCSCEDRWSTWMIRENR